MTPEPMVVNETETSVPKNPFHLLDGGDDRGKIPGPGRMRFIGGRGNLIKFYRSPLNYLRKVHSKYGELASFASNSPSAVIFAFGPKYNQLLLANPQQFHSAGLTIPGPENSAHRRIGRGIFSMNNGEHQQNRQLLMPGFHGRIIEQYHQRIVQLSQAFADRLPTNQIFNFSEEAKQYALQVSCDLLFGLDGFPHAEKIGELIEQWFTLDRSIGVRLFRFNYPGTPYNRLLKHAERLELEVLDMLRHKRANLKSEAQDVFSMLLQAKFDNGTSLTDAELVGQANMLFTAAHETTANTLTWMLFLLAQHPAIVAQLVDEMDGLLHGAPPSFEQLQKMPYLDAVIKESLRILPPVVFHSRLSTVPFRLGPYNLPERTTVVFSHYITHHMAEIYPEPEKFLPERWNTIKPTVYEYLPFGAGSRTCIGANFARMTLKIGLSILLQRYRFQVAPNAKIDHKVVLTMSPKHGMPMILHPQDRQFVASSVRGDIHGMVDLAS